MSIENMRPIPIAPRYLATEDGKIWDTVLERFKVQCLNGKPRYYYTTIRFPDCSEKLMRVHRLVAMAWHENPEGLDFVDHIDQDKLNNHKDNLRWATKSTNQRNTDRQVRVTWKGEDMLLVELCEKLFGAVKPHYPYIYKKLSKGESLPAAVAANCLYRKIPIPR